MYLDPLSIKTDIAADLLTAMANSRRLIILSILVQGEITVGALAEKVGLSQSALSQHLSKLRAMELVTTRRDAQTIYYSCSNLKVKTILETLAEIFAENADNTAAARSRSSSEF